MSSTLHFPNGAVLVAGGSGGIGAGICRAFAAAGISVEFTYHGNREKAEALAEELVASGVGAVATQLDLADSAAVTRWVEAARSRHERMAHVVYAAGPHFDFNFIGRIPDEQWHAVVNADINGAFHLAQASIRAFRAQGDGGNLVAVITSAVERVPVADIMSAAPKAAIEMLMRGVAKESGRFGIRANCVGPGWINAGLGKKGLEEKLDEKTREHIRKTTIPLQAFGEAEDIANTVLFLCSKQARYITGQSIAVDGGLQL